MLITVKIVGNLELVHSKQNDKGERNDRLMFLGGQFFVKNPQNIPAGAYAEIECVGENWGDQKGIRPREIKTAKPFSSAEPKLKA